MVGPLAVRWAESASEVIKSWPSATGTVRWSEYRKQVNCTWSNWRSTQYTIPVDMNSLQCNQIQFTVQPHHNISSRARFIRITRIHFTAGLRLNKNKSVFWLCVSAIYQPNVNMVAYFRLQNLITRCIFTIFRILVFIWLVFVESVSGSLTTL